MESSSSASSTRRPLVTVLCGFLGAGKTTLLNHLLKQAEGRSWAAVVNDVAAINIDAATVRSASGGGEGIVELGNGCVCCSSRDELGETIAELAASARYEHILVETTGVAEPRGIAALFTQRNPFGRSLSDFATLAALVSVVDAAQFLREWREHAGAARHVPGSGVRPVFELIVEQIECADIIVLNKTDLLAPGQIAEAEALIRSLNTVAELVPAEQSQIASEFLLGRVRFDPAKTLGAATWIKELNLAGAGGVRLSKVIGGEAAQRERRGWISREANTPALPRHEAEYGIRTCVFQARQPFDRAALQRVMREEISGLLRAKGFVWVKDQPDEVGFLSVAGGVLRLDFVNYWYAALIENGRVARADVPPAIEAVWRDPAGDRRQELIFIGVGLDEDRVVRQLQGALAEGT